ncbi:MAG TPA: hypothetical protein VGR78_06075 [Verrucomicrobiae bacterium]|nr:hypothetical protein [Verrucomicrobiae bacterium]
MNGCEERQCGRPIEPDWTDQMWGHSLKNANKRLDQVENFIRIRFI